MGYFDDLRTVATPGRTNFASHSTNAQWAVTCPCCGSGTMLSLAVGSQPRDLARATQECSAWLVCVNCGMGAFAVGYSDNARVLFPKNEPFGVPENLSDEVSGTWNEALKSFTASAYTGCALMCRKIIFHMAVEAGLPEEDGRGKGPSFFDCIDHLVQEGLITGRQKEQWVDSIRKWGNTATHKLAPVDEDVAYLALQFTYQLLQMVYAFPNAAPGGEKELEAAEKKAIPPSSGQAPTPSSGVPLD